MTEKPPTRQPLLPSPQARRVDNVCDRFEAAWQAVAQGGPRPRLEDYLTGAQTEDRTILLRELLLLELAYRHASDEELMAEDYRNRFPEDAALVQAAIGEAG